MGLLVAQLLGAQVGQVLEDLVFHQPLEALELWESQIILLCLQGNVFNINNTCTCIIMICL